MFEQSGFRVFSVRGIPVQLSFGFFLLMAIIVAMNKLTMAIPLALAISLSILIHELGHALVSKRYKLNPSILLHGFGGLCFHDAADTDGKDALIVVMGPLVEILFGILAFGAMLVLPATGVLGLDNFLKNFLTYFAWVSVIWGLANLLLPIYPLDGGKLLLLILRRFVDPRKAERWTLLLSMVVTVPLGVWALTRGMFFLGIVVMFMLMSNYQDLQSGRALIQRGANARSSAKASDFVQELFEEAEDAFAREDWREAARLCHQARAASGQIPKKMMDRMWEIMGLATAQRGEHEEALSYLKRAPQTAAVKAAIARCREALVDRA